MSAATSDFSEDEVDYDPAIDFAVGLDASSEPDTSSSSKWQLGDRVPLAQVLFLLPPVPESERKPRSGVKKAAQTASRDHSASHIESYEGVDRPGDSLSRVVPVSNLLSLLGWTNDGEMSDGQSKWVRPDHSEPYDGSHDAVVYPASDDEPEKVTIWSERQLAAWRIDAPQSWSSWDLLGNVFLDGEDRWHLAAQIARIVLADDDPTETLAAMLDQGDNETLDDVRARIRAHIMAAPITAASEIAERGLGRRVNTAIVDWDGECIKASNASDATVYIDAGLRIVRRSIVEDDLNPMAPQDRLYDVEVKSNNKCYTVRDVCSADLGRLRTWLDRIPEAVSDQIVILPVRTAEIEIEAALRTQMKADNPPVFRALRRIGWAAVGDRVGYVQTCGALTHTGLDTSLRAVVTGPAAAVCFDESSPVNLASDVRTVLSIPNLLSESGKNVLTALFGAMAWAHSGVTPPAAGLAILGERGSGKTALVRRILSALSPDPDSLLTSLDSSAGVIGSVGVGAHNSVTWVEDARDKPSERMGEEQSAAIDSLLRRTYGGGVVGRARLRLNALGRYDRQDPDRSSPMALITAEKLPSTTTISSLERCLSVDLMPKTPDEEPFDAPLQHLLAGGELRRTWAAFIKWLAARIDDKAPGDPSEALRVWQEYLVDMRGEIVKDLSVSGHLTTRQAEVVAGFICGWLLWTDFCTEAAVLDDNDELAMRNDGQLRLFEAARRHAVGVMDPGEVGPMSIINQLRQAVVGERWWIQGDGFPVPADVSRAELIGQVVVERETGKQFVALLHSTAAKAIGIRSGLELTAALGDLVSRSLTGRRTRVAKVRGASLRTVWIPLDVWAMDNDDLSVDQDTVAGSTQAGQKDQADEDF